MKKIRYALEAVLVYVLLFIFRIMPVDMASHIGGWLGRTIGPRLAASRKAKRNLAAALPDADHDKIIAGMWDNLGRVVAEYPHLGFIARHRTVIENGEALEKLKAGGGPVIIIGGHFANWEVPGVMALERYGIETDLTYRAPNNPWVEKILYKCRTRGGKLQAFPKSRSGAQQMLQTMRDGRFLGILIDQKYNEGIAVPFFGRPAMTNPFFVQIGQKYKGQVIPMRIERTDGANFKVTIQEALAVTNEKDENLPAEDVIAAAHGILEHWIRNRPEQWLWLHRRWPD